MKKRGLRIILPVLAAAGLALALAGCGDLSLLDTLQEESPGELRFSPSAAMVPADTEFTLSLLGGFTPYQVAEGKGLTPAGGNTWVFKQSVTGESELFRLEAADQLGHTAAAELTVYAQASPLELDVSELTLLVGQSWTFSATGGSGGYVWSVDGTKEEPPLAPDDEFTYTAKEAGIHTVEVADSIGLSQAATVTVESIVVGAPLEISPAEATVEVNRRLSFTAIGGSAPYAFEVLAGGAGGSITAAGNPATYLAPGAAGIDTIS